MYNLKVIKYPSGWQVRVYNTTVGAKDYDRYFTREGDPPLNLYWDKEQEQWIEYRGYEEDYWYNMFDGNFEPLPKIIKEPDRERSIKSSMGRSINKICGISRSNVWDWFITLTFNPEKVNSFDYDECVKRLSVWLNHRRSDSPSLKYLIVPEKHKSGRYHFHGLLADCGGIVFTDSGFKDSRGNQIYNIGSYRLGFSTATRVWDNERVTKYITKYITKELCETAFGRKRYWASRNLDQAEEIEMNVPGGQLDVLKAKLMSACKHTSACGDPLGMITLYYELGDNKNDDGRNDQVCAMLDDFAELYKNRSEDDSIS